MIDKNNVRSIVNDMCKKLETDYLSKQKDLSNENIYKMINKTQLIQLIMDLLKPKEEVKKRTNKEVLEKFIFCLRRGSLENKDFNIIHDSLSNTTHEEKIIEILTYQLNEFL